MKPTSAYKMTKAVKTLLGRIGDAHERGFAKRAFIDADLTAAIKPKEHKRERNNQETVNE